MTTTEFLTAAKTITCSFRAPCRFCTRAVKRGEKIAWVKGEVVAHEWCAHKASTVTVAA